MVGGPGGKRGRHHAGRSYAHPGVPGAAPALAEAVGLLDDRARLDLDRFGAALVALGCHDHVVGSHWNVHFSENLLPRKHPQRIAIQEHGGVDWAEHQDPERPEALA